MNVEYKQIEDLYFQKNYAKAFELANRLASDGNAMCIRLLGWMYHKGQGCERDNEKAITLFSEAAEKGDAEALYGKASIYYERKEYKKAFQYLEESMEKGYLPAIRWTGAMYYLGLGVEKDLHKAYDILDIASKAGSLSAYSQQSLMLLHGFKGIPGRIKSIPMLVKCFFCTFKEAMRDEHSQRLM